MNLILRKLLFANTLLCFVLFLSSCASSPTPEPRRATFSPDGQHLVFSIKYQDHSNIYRIRKDGAELTKLTSSPGYDFDPVYSPNGSKIVFSRICSSKYTDPANIYIMDSDGSNIAKLTLDNTSDTSPVFSPDGERIYFIRARWFGRHSSLVPSFWQNKDVFSIQPDGTDLKTITNESFYKVSGLSISPDGKEMLASLTINRDINSLWIIPIENPKAMRPIRPNLDKYITQDTAKTISRSSIYEDLFDPKFSPDGKLIAFVWAANIGQSHYYEYEIYAMDLESKDVKKLTNLKLNSTSPSFSPDGKEIAFLFDPRWPKGGAPYELWLVNSDGTNPRRINIDLNKVKQQ